MRRRTGLGIFLVLIGVLGILGTLAYTNAKRGRLQSFKKHLAQVQDRIAFKENLYEVGHIEVGQVGHIDYRMYTWPDDTIEIISARVDTQNYDYIHLTFKRGSRTYIHDYWTTTLSHDYWTMTLSDLEAKELTELIQKASRRARKAKKLDISVHKKMGTTTDGIEVTYLAGRVGVTRPASLSRVDKKYSFSLSSSKSGPGTVKEFLSLLAKCPQVAADCFNAEQEFRQEFE